MNVEKLLLPLHLVVGEVLDELEKPSVTVLPSLTAAVFNPAIQQEVMDHV